MKIEVPSGSKHIGVMTSGGVDSSILLYLLAKNNSNIRITTYTQYLRTDKFRFEIINRVIDWINNDLNIQIENVLPTNRKYIRDSVDSIIKVMGTDYVYTGCNLVIWDENKFVPTNYIEYDTPPIRGPALNEKHLRPFIDMDKIEITKLYIDNDIVDLLSLTRSCGYSRGYGYKNPCGGCYFCAERQWAMNSLGLENIYK